MRDVNYMYIVVYRLGVASADRSWRSGRRSSFRGCLSRHDLREAGHNFGSFEGGCYERESVVG